jgi:group I intron endonuclease
MPVAIYVVTNLINGKAYVGKTKHPVSVRWKQHKSAAHRSADGSYLGRAIRKYGEQVFVLYQIDRAETQEQANDLERKYILLYGSADPVGGYNLTHGGDGDDATEEVRRRMSESAKRRGPTIPKGFDVRRDISTPEITALYRTGESCASIASRFNTTRSTISWRLRRAGVKTRRSGFHLKLKETSPL